MNPNTSGKFFSIYSETYKKNSRLVPSKRDFNVKCLINSDTVGYTDKLYSENKPIPVSLTGVLINDNHSHNIDDNTNVVLIKRIKGGFSSEKDIVLLHGIVEDLRASVYSPDYVWFFRLHNPSESISDNDTLIYFPWEKRNGIPCYMTKYLKNGNDLYLIGYMGKRDENEDVLNSVYMVNNQRDINDPCPFLFSYKDSSNSGNNVVKYIRSDINNSHANNHDVNQFIYKFYQILINTNNIFKSVINASIPISNKLFNLTNLKDFDNLLKKDNVYYRHKDIINFFTAMKSRGLTILAGLSGTGKTQLVNLFAESLGISLDSNQFLHISVKPSWKDDSSLIGFLYPIKSSGKSFNKEGIKNYRYIPDNSGLIDTLIDANKPENKNKTYIILLDEMNLARVEYYFSQFLSELERPTKDRYIILYDKNDMNECVNAKQYKYRVHVGNNVHFVGTINTDESTYKISDKVLDRSNFITLPTFSTVLSCDDFVKTFSKWEQLEHMEGLKTDDLKILYTISKYLNNLSNQLGVSWRVVKGINEYLYNLPKFNQLEKQLPQYASEYKNSSDYIRCGFDYQIVQRILCKVSGTPNILLRVFSVPNDKNHSSKDDGKLYRLMSDKHLSISCKFITKKYLRLSDEYYDI